MIYLDVSRVSAHKIVPGYNRGQGRSGYGSKIATDYMLRIGSRWHRVYVCCWSNSGTCYVILRGENHWLASHVDPREFPPCA